ncbi:hypothetical protein [Elongatibacter sediminis]|uniref:Zinc ribbon domain-containing protein n=1 Tax=Elongatibacter sediminis TaxID=3119006 RepID=A0AAW9RQM4_9GAMM
MSIIACPGCGKRISSLSPLCLHCGLERGEADDEELHVFKLRQARQKVYHLNMTSYAVISVFVAAFGWYWWSTAGFQQPSSTGPFVLMGLSAVAYLAVRVLLYFARSRLKALKRNAP